MLISPPRLFSSAPPTRMTAATQILPKLDFTLTPEALLDHCRSSILKCRSVYDAIGALAPEQCSLESVLVPWSQAEAEFTTQTASCSFPQYVSTCPATREASIEATKLIDEFGIETGMREDLFRAAKAIENETLSGEFKRFHERLLREFKHNGLFLESEGERAELKEKRQRLADLCTEFSRNMNDDATELLFTREELDGATEDFLSSLKTCEQTGKLRVSMKYPDLFGVLRNVRSETVRQLMDTTNGRKCEKNRALLAEAVMLRQECARMLGYPEHASFRLENKMAKEPARAIKFLRDLQEKLMPFAQRELEKLTALKRTETNNPEATFNSWDYQFYTRILLERDFSLNEELLRQYFPLPHVISEMLKIFERVLGLAFKRVEGAWERKLVWHEEAQLWEVWNSSENGGDFVGHFYLDLHPRDGKYTHAACWDLQPGFTLLPTPTRQFPVAAMVANFTRPTGDKPSLLKHDEVVTLFHELGHAMHDMCAHVQLSRFHGTSVEYDFVEAPSQMLENWCWQAQELERLSSHYLRPQERLPQDLIHSLIATKNLNAGLMNCRQLFFALWDLHIHSQQQGTLSADDIDAAYERMRREIALIPQPSRVWPAASFGHMMGGYDAGYYGYLWSQVFSADMFYSRFLPSIEEPEQVGAEYRREVIGVGGSRDASVSLKAFLGREPQQESFLRSLGLM